MLKKAIASFLCAFICATSLLCEMPVSTPDIPQESAPAASQSKKTDGLSGSNSLAKYLQQQSSPQSVSSAHQIKAEAADPTYSVTNLEFDRETGVVRIISSQTYAQKVVVSFTDEDDPTNVYRLEAEAAAGTFVLTEINADTTMLPDYYTVSAHLENRIGQPVCDAFTLKTYTHFVQEVREQEISDFEPEQVVNLDDNTQTNFLVLSEDTVQANSTDFCNTLVSADYDQNIYVFDHIDETIRSLETGQFFFIQPTEADIISIKVQDIQIDGEKATLTGNTDIDDMFDCIKIELSGENECTYIDDSNVSDETIQTSEHHYLSGNTANGQPNDNLKVDAEFNGGERELNFSRSFTSSKKVVSCDLNIKLQFRNHLNIYKKGFSRDYQFVLETTAKASITGQLTKPDGSLKTSLKDIMDEPLEGVSIDKDGKTVRIPTAIPGIDIVAKMGIDFKPTLVGEASLTYQSVRGFYYDGDFHEIKADGGLTERKLDIKASAELKLTVEAALSVFRILEGGVEFTFSVAITAEMSYVEKLPSLANGNTQHLYAFSVKDSEANGSTVHACDECIHGNITIKIDAGVYLKLLVIKFPIVKVPITLLDKDWYYSLSYGDIGLGTCPHIAYKTTLKLNCNYIGDSDLGWIPSNSRIVVDGYAQAISSGETTVYCTKGNHEYYVELDGHAFPTDHFIINDETKTLQIPLTLVVESNHQINYELSGAGENGHTESNVTAVTTAPVTTDPPAVTMGTVPQIWADYKENNAVKLGENVFGHSYNGGYIWIHGSGPMYDFDRTPFNSTAISNVTHIMIENSDAENGIQNIGANLFNGAKNLETVYLPQTVTKIGNGAFSGCESLQYLRYGGEEDTSETFVLPNQLSVIGAAAFSGCKSAAFGTFTLPKSIQSIGANAFEGCEGITSLTIPGNSRAVIGERAFKDCINLKKAVLSEGIDTIGLCIFSGCYNMEDLTVPYFGLYADDTKNRVYAYFDIDEKWQSGHFGMQCAYVIQTVWTQGWHDYYYLPGSLQNITITNGDTVPSCFFQRSVAVDDTTQYNTIAYSPLQSITLPATISTIQAGAFQNCTNLKHLHNTAEEYSAASCILPNQLNSIGASAFSGCSSLEFGDLRLPESIQSIGANAFDGCEGITELTIPGDSGVEIGQQAFKDCVNIQKAVLCDGIQAIGENAFLNCINIEEITIPFFGLNPNDNTNPFFAMLGKSWTPQHHSEVWQVLVRASMYYTIPKTLKKVTVTGGDTVPAGFFEYNVNLNDTYHNATPYNTIETIILPSSLTSVQNNAFSQCNDIETAYLIGQNADWNNVEISEIGNEPLLNCQHITRPVKTLAAPRLRTLWNGLHVQWTTEPNADGYQVQYCQDPSFTGETLHTWDRPADKTECSLTKYPQLGETWYVRVRAFMSGDNTQYGLWSDSTCITLIASIDNVSLSQSVFPYTGKAVKVGNYITVKSGDRKLKYGTDFTMTYTNNNKAGYQTASVTVTGVGNYTGTITEYYTITPAQQATPVLSALSNGIKVQWNTDPNADGYQVQYCQDSSFTGDTLHTGTYTKEKASCSLTKYPEPGETWYVRVRAYVSNDGSTTGTKAGSYSEAECITIPISISSVELSKTVFPYTGKAVKAGNYITVKSGDTKLKYETDFTMTYSDNIKAGYRTASVTVTGVGKYTGTITKYYTIAPAQQEKPLLSALTNGIRVQWKADPNADGYRVQYCQDSSFTGETLHTWDRPKDKTECSLTKYPKPGETWYVRVRAFVSSDGTETGTQAGTYSDAECISLVNVPIIKKQPVSVLLPIGSTAKFTIEATGKDLTFQWQYNRGSGWKDSTLGTAKTATVSVPVKEERDGQQYRCIVTSSGGTSVISDVAVITVNVNITKQPEDVTLPIGQTATFTVEATGKDLTFQWQYNRGSGWKDSTLGTAKTATVSLPVKEEHDGQQYRCIVTSSNGTSVISDIATLKVKVSITNQPINLIVPASQTAIFTVEAAGAGALTYQWQYNNGFGWKNSNASGATTSTLKFTAKSDHNNNRYRCIVTSSNGTSVTSNIATFTCN